MAKRPTEADLGIAPSEEEIATQSAPAPEETPVVEPEVVPRDDLPEEIAEFTDREIAEGKDKLKHGPDGKFVAKTAADVAKEEANKTAALREARDENKRLMERMTQLLEIQTARETRAAQPKPVEQPAIPDKTVDPLGYIDYMDKRLAGIETERTQTATQRAAADREQAEMDQVLSVARPQYEEAAKADPTIIPTYQALLNSFGQEIMYVNRQNPEFIKDNRGFLEREMRKLENAHIKFAVSNRMNVAEYMKGLADSRGVKAGPAQPAPQQQRSIPERQQQQERHMSLGDAPGGEAPKPIDARTIAKMSNAEFARFAKSMSESDLDALMGGRG